jgi:hypothetical protein
MRAANRFREEDEPVNLSPPTQLVYIISVVVALLGVLAALGVVSFIPMASVWVVTIAFVILAVACLVKGA